MFKILSKPNCVHCTASKQALNFKGLPYEEVMHDTDELIEQFKAQGYRTFPQVFDPEGNLIGGNSQLQNYLLEKN